MRLGDLDALKKSFIQWSCSGCAFRTSENPTEICCEDCYAKDIEKEVIDNAETIVNEYTNGFADGERSGRHFPLTDEEKAILVRQWRSKGEWIRTGSLGNGNAHYECSECHYGDEHAESQEVPYCWHCGAEMKGGSE